MTYDKASYLAGLRAGLALPRVPKPKSYLTFASEDGSDFTLSINSMGANPKSWDGTIYYSTDAKIWSVWNGDVLSSNNGVLHLRGSGNTHIIGAIAPLSAWAWVLTEGKRIRCIGNIETLLDWETVVGGQHPPMSASCFYGMFWSCTSLTSAPELPATALADRCYDNMFYNCTSLTSAPELPAKKLAIGCYDSMFRGCTSLTSTPELPATSLREMCYNTMFQGCTSLTSMPKLPATILRDSCYLGMYEGCTSLKLATTQDATYQYPYRIPTSGTGVIPAGQYFALYDMFAHTGGPFTGTPYMNKTYYTDHPPIPAE